MIRRDFIKLAGAGTVLLSAGGYRVCLGAGGKTAFTADRNNIPVIAAADVLVLGGSLAAISAAATAAEAGKSVYLVSSRTYLGDDICGQYRYWLADNGSPQTPLLKKLFPEGLFSKPFDVKRALDKELLDRKIPFLFSSYVVDILFDGKGAAAGAVIANRTGLQIITAGVIIDATTWATAARLAGAKVKAFTPGTYRAGFITVGGKPVENAKISSRVMPADVLIAEDKAKAKGKSSGQSRSWKAYEYTVALEMKGNSHADLAKAEQDVRTAVWDVAQQATGEDIFGLNYSGDFMKIICRASSSDKVINPGKLDAACFIPKDIEGLYLLSDCADVSGSASKDLFYNLDNAVIAGASIGKAALQAAAKGAGPDAKGGGSSSGSAGTARYTEDFFRDASPHGELRRMNAGSDSIPVWGEYDTVVIGGGTAGAPAAIAAARNGAKTLICEQLHGLGGISTLGMIGKYWFGYRKGFTSEIDNGVSGLIGTDKSSSRKEIKMQWYRSEILKAGGEIWFDALACGAVMDGTTVKGVVIATPYGRGIVLANTVIDATGSADVAIAAGAGYKYSDGKSVAVQGSGLYDTGPGITYHNTDWCFIDDSDVFDIWRAFVTARQKYQGVFDLVQIPQTRERRRVIGDMEINAMDIFNGRTYPDTISHHYSNFDTHGFTVTPYFFMQPNHKTVTANVPMRCLLPKGLDGIVVTGLGASCHRDAMPVIRMQPCVQNQGYAMGMASAMAAKNKLTIRKIDIKQLQKQLVDIGNLSQDVLKSPDNFAFDESLIEPALKTVGKDFEGLEILLWDEKRTAPAMKKRFAESNDKAYRTQIAIILGHLGYDDGVAELVELVNSWEEWDAGWSFRGLGQFGASGSKMDSALIALGKTGSKKAVQPIIRMAEKTDAKQNFSHFRALAVAAENLNAPELAPSLAKLLKLDGVQGHEIVTIDDALAKMASGKNSHADTSTRNKSLRELFLARGLYRCGDQDGLGERVLRKYSRDLRGHYARHALGILAAGKNRSVEA